jgi:hypothetical protein
LSNDRITVVFSFELVFRVSTDTRAQAVEKLAISATRLGEANTVGGKLAI